MKDQLKPESINVIKQMQEKKIIDTEDVLVYSEAITEAIVSIAIYQDIANNSGNNDRVATVHNLAETINTLNNLRTDLIMYLKENQL